MKIMKIDITQLDSKNFTHYLQCRHCIGSDRCRVYYMKCILLDITKSGKIKIAVFGERNWKGREYIKRIRYANSSSIFNKNEIVKV